MGTLKQIAVGLAVVVIVCLGMTWYTMAPEAKGWANRAAEARGWREPFVEQESHELSWQHTVECPDMAKCPVTSGSYGGTVTMRMKVTNRTGPGAGTGLMRPANVLRAVAGEPWGSLVYVSEDADSWLFWARVGFGAEGAMNWIGQYIDIPKPASDVDATYSWVWTWHFDDAYIDVTAGTTPIGEKAATHAKECTVAESWAVPEGATVTTTLVGDCDVDLTYTREATFASMTMAFGLATNQIDFWDDNGYVVRFDDIEFSGEAVDTSTYTKRLIGTHDEAWVEGIGNSFRFWCEPGVLLGPEANWSENISAPYQYNFANLQFKWLDGTEVDDSLEVYCTGLRTLSAGGVDIGPWHGSISDLRSKTWTQQHGCYSWDTWDPDMQAEVQLYLDLTSAEALGIDVRGPRPAYKVEGAGYAAVPPTPSPVDGQYAPAGTYNGETMFSNGLYYLYCTDPSGPDWGIGPGPGSDPYYTQDGGGPAGSYVANTGSYGAVYLGDAPSVSADTTEAISLDSHLATPSFQHDGTVIFDCWPLSAVNRTDAPYMTDICTLTVDGTKGIYASAHTHEDWVGTNCGTPTAGGEFTVGAGGGSLELALASNLEDRLAAVGEIDAIPVPTAYRVHRHDELFGTGNPVEEREAVYDWRGRYLLQSFKDLSLPCDIVCECTYRELLSGYNDNHKSDSTRQTTFSVELGPLNTLRRTITVSYADVSGWSPVLVDLYDEQNGTVPGLVKELRWEFPAAGTLTMTEPQLVLDPGDRQEVASGTPGYREAPSSIGAVLKIDEHWQYAQGVVSAHVNGLCDRVLYMPDHAKPCTIERCFDTLDVLIGAQTGQDLTTVFALGAWPITNSGEAWTWTHSAANEAAHMKDSDDVVLKTLTVADIRPEWALAASGSTITPSVAVRCYSITCVRGLAYTFYGRKIVGGRGHGMVVRNGRQDYPRARGGRGGGLYRRHLGSSDPWQGVEAALTGDEHGHWSSGAHEISDDDAARTLWEYAAGGVLMGRFATREFALAQIFELLRKQPDLAEDKFGRPVVVYVHDGDVWCSRIETLAGVPEAPIMVVDADDAIHPAVELMDDGLLVVTWTDGGAAYMRHSTDGGQTWVDVV